MKGGVPVAERPEDIWTMDFFLHEDMGWSKGKGIDNNGRVYASNEASCGWEISNVRGCSGAFKGDRDGAW